MNWTREYDDILGEAVPSAEYSELLQEIQGIREDAQRHHEDIVGESGPSSYKELLGEMQGIREDAERHHHETNQLIIVCVTFFVLWKVGFLGFLSDLSALLFGVVTALVK